MVPYYRIPWTSFQLGSRPICRDQGGDTGFIALEFRFLHLLANGDELIFERLDFGLEGKGFGVLRLTLNLKSVDDVALPAELGKLVRGPLLELLDTDLHALR